MKFKQMLFMVSAGFVLVHIVIMIPCGQVAAQELHAKDIVNIYDQKTIYFHYSILGNGFVKDGRIMNIGVFGSNLAREMSGSEYALEEMKKVRKFKIASAITGFAATTLGVTVIVMALRNSDSEDSLAFELTSLAIGGICSILGEAFNRSAMSTMNRAVWLYNRDVMSGQIRYRVVPHGKG